MSLGGDLSIYCYSLVDEIAVLVKPYVLLGPVCSERFFLQVKH